MIQHLGTATGADLYEIAQDVSILVKDEFYSIDFKLANTKEARLRFNRVNIRNIVSAQGALLEIDDIGTASKMLLQYDGEALRIISSLASNPATQEDIDASIGRSFHEIGLGNEIIPKFGIPEVYMDVLWEMDVDGNLQIVDDSVALEREDARWEAVEEEDGSISIIPKVIEF